MACLWLTLSACTVVGPDFVKPETDVPADWNTSLDEDIRADAQALARWWESFDDLLLNELVKQ